MSRSKIRSLKSSRRLKHKQSICLPSLNFRKDLRYSNLLNVSFFYWLTGITQQVSPYSSLFASLRLFTFITFSHPSFQVNGHYDGVTRQLIHTKLIFSSQGEDDKRHKTKQTKNQFLCSVKYFVLIQSKRQNIVPNKTSC